MFPAMLLLAALQAPAAPDAARLSALEATCLGGRAEKCLEAGRARLRAGDRDAAAGLYGKACSGGIPEGCLGLATRAAGFAWEARERGELDEARGHADKGLSLLRQAAKTRPSDLDIAQCEGWLFRLKALLSTGREASGFTARAKEAEARADALRQAMGGGYAPDVFWRPAPGTLVAH
jgi:hypothetical protein